MQWCSKRFKVYLLRHCRACHVLGSGCTMEVCRTQWSKEWDTSGSTNTGWSWHFGGPGRLTHRRWVSIGYTHDFSRNLKRHHLAISILKPYSYHIVFIIFLKLWLSQKKSWDREISDFRNRYLAGGPEDCLKHSVLLTLLGHMVQDSNQALLCSCKGCKGHSSSDVKLSNEEVDVLDVFVTMVGWENRSDPLNHPESLEFLLEFH